MLLPYVLAAATTPLDTFTGSLTDYILNFGILGVVAVAFATRLIVPRSAVNEIVERARTDLVAENQRLVEEKRAAEEQVRASTERIVPLLENFVHATNTLIPILQGLVRYSLPPGERDTRDGDRR